MGKAARPRHPTNPSLLSHAGEYYAAKPEVAPESRQRLQSRTDVRYGLLTPGKPGTGKPSSKREPARIS